MFRYDSKSPGIKYNITSIIDSIAASKELVDPVTRLPLKARDINLLDRKAIKLGLTPVTLSCRKRRKAQQRELQAKQITSNLDVILGGFVSELLGLIESKASRYDVDNQITILFSEFTQPFTEYKELHLEAAYMALSSWQTFLKGSPRHPTPTANGRLQVVLDKHNKKTLITFLTSRLTKCQQCLLILRLPESFSLKRKKISRVIVRKTVFLLDQIESNQVE